MINDLTFLFTFSQTPHIFGNIQRELQYDNLPKQQLSWKQHIFGMRDHSLLLEINFCQWKLIQASVFSKKLFKSWLLMFQCIFPFGTAIPILIFNIAMSVWQFMCFIEAEMCYFIQKIREQVSGSIFKTYLIQVISVSLFMTRSDLKTEKSKTK